MLFVGERRSNRAIEMNVQWSDGRLAAKQLFDALKDCGVDPQSCAFTNWFEKNGEETVRKHLGPVIAMERKVQDALQKSGIRCICMIHPAARGTIRRKDLYTQHVASVLSKVSCW